MNLLYTIYIKIYIVLYIFSESYFYIVNTNKMPSKMFKKISKKSKILKIVGVCEGGRFLYYLLLFFEEEKNTIP